MVEAISEAESSGCGVTLPYRRTEHCDKIHEYRSGRAIISRGISKRGNKYLRSLLYFLAEVNSSRNSTLLSFTSLIGIDFTIGSCLLL
ncbi:hypothetical protein LD85_2809 [Saccharolobus islandicus L.D.8.5]|uniref:Transposase IS116/IS110/IS902 C-terminal domain-containing protein n=1 Tax=Saccharolobus islandicus (strain L.D.8.5 / Lassen \|nr:hypothetical protein LD85_2809 [Sulfolobus islandicus L.D.8.5]